MILTGLCLAGCDENNSQNPNATSGNCQDSVKILTPNPASSASVEHVCTRGSKLKLSDKDQSLVAVCRCPEQHIDSVDGGDAGETKK